MFKMIRQTRTLFISLMLIILSVLLTSCLTDSATQNTRNTSTQSTTNIPVPEKTPSQPTYGTSKNYFHEGSNKSAYLNLDIDFTDSFYLRGKQIDQFIQNNNTSKILCLVTYYKTLVGDKVLVSAAKPLSFRNFKSNTLEYYYHFEPALNDNNKNFCQKTGLIVQMNTAYPNSSVNYSLSNLCPTCTSPFITSESIALYSPSGHEIENVDISYLKVQLRMISQTTTVVGSSCTSSSNCIAQGYDCCSLGQCVKDRQVKAGVDQSSTAFIQALADIEANPSNITNYLEFFHVCSTVITATPTPTPVADPQDETNRRLLELQELYQCTKQVKGEMSICTITYTNSTKNAPSDYPNTGITFLTGADDRNFNSTYSGRSPYEQGYQAPPAHSVTEIIHAGETLFNLETDGSTFSFSSDVRLGTGNDNLTDTQSIILTHVKSPSAPNDDLKIKYKIDGSCQIINNSLAKCHKYYVQGQNIGAVDDHYPASNNFYLPTYTDTTKVITVEVDDTQVLVGSQWQLNLGAGSNSFIEFLGSSLQVYDGQTVKISFYVNTTSNPIMQKKLEALQRIDQLCDCGGSNKCLLKPITETVGGNEVIKDYACVYPPPVTPDPPLQQTVLLNAKTVPVRYFDNNGTSHATVTAATASQEGNEFKYINNDLLKPNNISSYVGFNEVYGSLSYRRTGAQPAKEIRVTIGKTYDIFVDSGSFSNCYYCGNDYYTNMAKMFPRNFLYKGGGYSPDPYITNRSATTTYRSDDLLFGRACFIPVSMIPWTHKESSDRQQQRLNRLAAQHFLFANGYQKDWYGFDYGAIIGSFDGVRWFAVGNQRRIKATSNKLFLAVNAYFGDLTSESDYKIVVSDASTIPSSGSTVFNDLQSDGAECQQHHLCESDKDCIANLGWDYTCQSISNIKTNWPLFDSNAYELPDTEEMIRIKNLIGNPASGSKRCVYRGKGSPCVPDYANVTETNSYCQTSILGLHGCSSNNYCQVFQDLGLPISKFNTKISRYGKSIKAQNASSDVPYSDADTFGLGTRIIGRPYNFNGDESINAEVQASLYYNQVNSICIPGRNPNNDTLVNANSNATDSNFLGDLVTGIGMSYTGTSAAASSYLSSCSVLNSLGNYFVFDSSNKSKSLDDSELVRLASSQVVPTNALSIFEGLDLLAGQELIKNFESEQITAPILQENRCLRAPGSVCHTNIDCAPSSIITDKLASLEPTNYASIINEYEIRFWQETLICSQEKEKGAEEYEHKDNRCCREVGKNITIPTKQEGTNIFNNELIPATGIALSDSTRYSRWTTVYNEMVTSPDSYPKLEYAEDNACSVFDTGADTCTSLSSLKNQFNTFATLAERTCCTGHWIRNFHEENGGGHKWEKSKSQNIPKDTFKCYNWSKCVMQINDPADPTGTTKLPGNCSHADNPAHTNGPFLPFTCDHTDTPDDPGCLMRNIPVPEATKIFNWFINLELIGIPQARIETEDYSVILCRVDPNAQENEYPYPPPNIIKKAATEELAEYEDTNGIRYYSGNDPDNFHDNIKRIFSPDTITCCYPAGTLVPEGTDSNSCCTGLISSQTGRCALNDYTNVSVYFNRYVSSAASKLSSSLFDSKTGFIINPEVVQQLACEEKVCASGKIARGIALSQLKIPGKHTNDEEQTFRTRFIDGNDESNKVNGLDELYDLGLRWNNNVYCVPAGIEEQQSDSGGGEQGNPLTIIDCLGDE